MITFTTNVATVATVAESGLAAIIVQIGQHFLRRDGSDSRRIEADENRYTYTIVSRADLQPATASSKYVPSPKLSLCTWS